MLCAGGLPDRRGFRWTRLVWSVLAAFSLLLGLAVPAEAEDGSWDPTLPPVISAGAPGDPVAIANQSLQATASATQTTLIWESSSSAAWASTWAARPPAPTEYRGSTGGRRSST